MAEVGAASAALHVMGTPEVLRREIKALAFDQYGTIVDMQKGLTEAVTPFLKGKGWAGNANSFVTWWRRTHFENSMIGDEATMIRFVANRDFDCISAKTYGMRPAFVNRRKRPFGHTPHQPDLVVTNFAELAAVLA